MQCPYKSDKIDCIAEIEKRLCDYGIITFVEWRKCDRYLTRFVQDMENPSLVFDIGFDKD